MPASDCLFLLIAVCLTQGIVVAILVRRTRALERQLKALHTRRNEVLGDVPTSMLVRMLSQLERRMAGVEEAARCTTPAAASGDRSYELAQRLARQGAGTEQIVEACGISRQEAELLRHLNAPS